jgi:hypothetical protein
MILREEKGERAVFGLGNRESGRNDKMEKKSLFGLEFF